VKEDIAVKATSSLTKSYLTVINKSSIITGNLLVSVPVLFSLYCTVLMVECFILVYYKHSQW